MPDSEAIVDRYDRAVTGISSMKCRLVHEETASICLSDDAKMPVSSASYRIREWIELHLPRPLLDVYLDITGVSADALTEGDMCPGERLDGSHAVFPHALRRQAFDLWNNLVDERRALIQFYKGLVHDPLFMLCGIGKLYEHGYVDISCITKPLDPIWDFSSRARPVKKMPQGLQLEDVLENVRCEINPLLRIELDALHNERDRLIQSCADLDHAAKTLRIYGSAHDIAGIEKRIRDHDGRRSALSARETLLREQLANVSEPSKATQTGAKHIRQEVESRLRENMLQTKCRLFPN